MLQLEGAVPERLSLVWLAVVVAVGSLPPASRAATGDEVVLKWVWRDDIGGATTPDDINARGQIVPDAILPPLR